MSQRTYGRVRLKSGHWVIDAEPHVIIRLKRWFARLSRQHGQLIVKATDEVCRDLLWFSERWPLEIEHLDRMKKQARAHERRTATFASLLDGQRDPRNFDLALPARSYQRVAADLVLQANSLLVADDLGLGKTLIGICLMTLAQARPALVVTLTHLPTQWRREIGRFAPELRTHIVKKGRPYELAQGELFSPDVLIMNYHKLSGWAESLAGRVRLVVFDECQELRRNNSLKADAARHVAEKADYRLGLSATPFYNYGSEMFNVLGVLRPGALGTWDEFLSEWCVSGMGGQNDRVPVAQPKGFGTYLREQGLMIRRTRREVGRELPPLSKVVHHVDSDPEALEAVADDAAELAKLILSENPLERGERMRAGEELSWRLRQATGIAKAVYVAEFVKLLVETGEQVVLYGWHREVYRIWQERLRLVRPALYTGTESPNQKEQSREAFLKGRARVLMMSLRAGAGLDGLQACCRTVVFGELDWSPGVHEQDTGRVYRDGQQDPVVAYYLVSDSGSDPVVADTLGLKRAQIEGVRDPHAELVEKLEGAASMKRLAQEFLRQHSSGTKTKKRRST